MADSKTMDALIGQIVVLDAVGPMVYIGTLDEVTPHGYWLADADVHDRSDGQASKELYVVEAKLHGVRTNRHRVFVMASTVLSLSKLDDVVT